MKKFVFRNTSSTYISELPEYKVPSAKYVFKDVNVKGSSIIPAKDDLKGKSYSKTLKGSNRVPFHRSEK